MPKHKLQRDADTVIVDDETGTWFAVWNVHEGFDPFTAAIQATSRSAAEEVWFERFPDRGEPETLHIAECTLTINVVIDWPDGEVTPELADNPDSVKSPEPEGELSAYFLNQVTVPHQAWVRKLLADWFQARLNEISERGGSHDWQDLIDDAKARHAGLGIEWDDSFVPDYVRQILAMDSDI